MVDFNATALTDAHLVDASLDVSGDSVPGLDDETFCREHKSLSSFQLVSVVTSLILMPLPPSNPGLKLVVIHDDGVGLFMQPWEITLPLMMDPGASLPAAVIDESKGNVQGVSSLPHPTAYGVDDDRQTTGEG